MRRNGFNHISGLRAKGATAAVVAAWAIMASGCATEDAPLPAQRTTLELQIRAADYEVYSPGSTRGESRSAGTDSENRIDELTVLAFDADGNRIGSFNAEQGGDMHTVTISADSPEYSGNVTYIALANWREFAGGNAFESVGSVEELRKTAFTFTADWLAEGKAMPMYGEVVVNGTTGTGTAAVELTRALAKVEIKDGLERYGIKSATMKGYSTTLRVAPGEEAPQPDGKDLTMLYDEQGKTYYAYVPEMALGAEDSDARRIELTVGKDGEEATELYTVWLKDYTTGDAPTYGWTELERNYRYYFNVKSIEEPTPPTPDIRDTVVVRWYNTYLGKFLWYYRNSSDYDNLKLLVKYGNQADVEVIAVKGRNPWSHTEPQCIEFNAEIPLTDRGWKLEDIHYIIEDSWFWYPTQNPKDIRSRWNDEYSGLLADDILQYNDENEKTICMLNTLPMRHSNGYDPLNSSFKSGNYRIYWRGYSDISKVDLKLEAKSNNIIKTFKNLEVQSEEKRGYHFVEFTNSDKSLIYISYDFKNQDDVKVVIPKMTQDNVEPELVNADFFPLEIDGKEYYVFYAN